ncbi:LamG-like jellyroll fold domain-containing protein [Streptomyces uncialis]|uniref:LamG-like jellyroll fold domain-containing protein n=1 Tax=Streptomyces uncialis TaxID=1048205 RepID=UPI0033E4975C
MVQVAVEAAFGYTVAQAVTSVVEWTDITRYVDMVTGIRITRGASDEVSEVQPGTASLVLDNQDAFFTPGNSFSPFWPHVGKNVPVKISVATRAGSNHVQNPGFEGGSEGEGLDAWQWTPGVEAGTVASPVQSGARAARITWGPSATGAMWTRVYGLTVGSVYTASAYVHVPAGDIAARLRVGWDTATSAVTGSYVRLSVQFTATDVVMPLQVEPAGTPTAGDQVYVDSVQVNEGAAALPYSSVPAQMSGRFWGMVNQWPVTWEGLHAKVQIAATDVFKSLSRTEALRPMVTEEILRQDPAACYPMDEDADATSAGDVSGTSGPQPLTLLQAGSGGTLEFAGGKTPLGVSAAPLFSPASSTSGLFLRGDIGSDFADAMVTQSWKLEVWFATSTAGRGILGLSGPGGYISFSLSGTGYLTVESRAGGPANVAVLGSTNLANGKLHHLVYDEAGGQAVYIDGVFVGSGGGTAILSDLNRITVGGTNFGADLWNGTVCQIGLYADASVPTSELTSHWVTGTTGHRGETAADRGFRICSYVSDGGLFASVGGFTTGIAEQAALGKTPLEHLRDLANAEAAKLYARRDDAGVILQSRTVRYNPVPSLTLEYADLETGDVHMADDDQKLINTIEATRPGGATQRFMDRTSRAANGPYEQSIELLVTSDAVVTDAANWKLYRYADPEPELREVPIEAYSMPLATYRALLAADISTVLTVTGLPPQAPAPSATVTVEGYAETLQQGRHLIAFHTSSTVTDTVWVLDDPVYSVLGQSTRLAY